MELPIRNREIGLLLTTCEALRSVTSAMPADSLNHDIAALFVDSCQTEAGRGYRCGSYTAENAIRRRSAGLSCALPFLRHV